MLKDITLGQFFPADTVKSRISRAKMRLRELLDGSGNLFDGGAVLQTEISERREQP